MIKARIEALIEREYLERDESNMKVYKYLVLPCTKEHTDEGGITTSRISLHHGVRSYICSYLFVAGTINSADQDSIVLSANT